MNDYMLTSEANIGAPIQMGVYFNKITDRRGGQILPSNQGRDTRLPQRPNLIEVGGNKIVLPDYNCMALIYGISPEGIVDMGFKVENHDERRYRVPSNGERLDLLLNPLNPNTSLENQLQIYAPIICDQSQEGAGVSLSYLKPFFNEKSDPTRRNSRM